MDQTVMRAGVHRATFTIGGDNGDGTVVAAGVGCFSIGVLKRSALVGRVYWDGMMWFRHSIEDAWSPSANEAWAWEANTGRLTPNDDEDFRDWPLANPGGEWAGQQPYEAGDVVELELDLRRGLDEDLAGGGGGTLTAFKNGERLGVMAAGFAKEPDTEFCWFAQLASVGSFVTLQWSDPGLSHFCA